MPIPPGRDELLVQAQLRARIDGTPPPPRARDWFDDYLDATTRPAEPPQPPDKPPAAATDTPGEPRWDWHRLLRWPYARHITGACVALIPVQDGYSAATGWGNALQQARAQAGVGAAWTIASTGLLVGAIWVNRRRSWFGWCLLTSAFIGTVAMASPLDIVRLVSGAF
jgi:hypothetical protein